MDGIPDELCDCATESTEAVERTRVGPVLHVKRTPCGNSTAAPAEIEYRHFDHLGSSASITDAAGAERSPSRTTRTASGASRTGRGG